MDLKAITALRNKLDKEQKKKDAGLQKPVDAFFKKDGAAPVVEGTSKGAGEGPQVEGGTRKRAGKGQVPPEKKRPKKGAAEKIDIPVLNVEELSSSQALVSTPPRSPAVPVAGESWPRDRSLREEGGCHRAWHLGPEGVPKWCYPSA
ncbi:unnamed protein product [Cuscuta epithymum]|uniref:Uncharacterized protein n=1 Tax=Cuscuta epithymum TaxID=186058 RepID=A0AAV0GDU5_9ASTE|nr:unnamed protein product [Cuscuta epithymum]